MRSVVKTINYIEAHKACTVVVRYKCCCIVRKSVRVNGAKVKVEEDLFLCVCVCRELISLRAAKDKLILHRDLFIFREGKIMLILHQPRPSDGRKAIKSNEKRE